MSMLQFNRWSHQPPIVPIAFMRVEFTIFRCHLVNTAWALLDSGERDPSELTRTQIEQQLRDDITTEGMLQVENFSGWGVSVDIAEEVINRLWPDLTH